MSNKYFKDLPYTLLEKKVAYKGKRVTVEELTYMADGKKIYREHVGAGDAAVILAITNEGNVIMVQEPRTPINKTILGLPAGQIEEGEVAENGAKRELEEETGYRAGKVKKLREVYPSVGYTSEKITVFLATDLVKTKQHLDDDEDINVVELPLDEVKCMLDKNEIITSSSTVALMHYFLYENGNNKNT